jgi:sugar/nucleoside kinase (ribokinase family)
LFYADTFRFFIKEFIEYAEKYLQDISSSVIHTQEAIQAVSIQLVNTLSSVSTIANKTSTMTHDTSTCLLMMESKLDDLLQGSDIIKCNTEELLDAYYAVCKQNTQLLTVIDQLICQIIDLNLLPPCHDC